MDNELEGTVPPGPACPGRIKTRSLTTRSILSSISDVLGAFTRLKEELSNSGAEVFEEAFLELLVCYDIPVSELSSCVSSKYSVLACLICHSKRDSAD